MSRLAHAVGLVVGYAGVCLALRMADAVDVMLVEAAQRAADQLAAGETTEDGGEGPA